MIYFVRLITFIKLFRFCVQVVKSFSENLPDFSIMVNVLKFRTLLILFYNKMLVISRLDFAKCLSDREDSDQTASELLQKQSDLGLRCLPRSIL